MIDEIAAELAADTGASGDSSSGQDNGKDASSSRAATGGSSPPALRVAAFPSKSTALLARDAFALMCRSDSNSEDLEGCAGRLKL